MVTEFDMYVDVRLSLPGIPEWEQRLHFCLSVVKF
jgi:hypothetical protein